MDQVISLIRQFIDLFRFWIIVCPWEQAVRVRLGKRVNVLGPGTHFRIPLADHVFLQSTRLRICSTYRQTVTTKDGKTVMVTASVGYAIADVLVLYNSSHHAEDTVTNVVRALVAQVIPENDSTSMTSRSIAIEATGLLDLKAFGMCGECVYVTEFAMTRAYRLIGDHAQTYQLATSLSTEKENTSAR